MTFVLGRTVVAVAVLRRPREPRRSAAAVDQALQERIRDSRVWLYRRSL